MSPSWQLKLTFFLTSFFALTSPLTAADRVVSLGQTHAAMRASTVHVPTYNPALSSQKMFLVYALVGLINNYMSKEFGRHFINSFLEVPKGSEKSAVLSVALKSFWNDVWKNLLGHNQLLLDIQEKDEDGNPKLVNGKFYAAGNKLMSVLEFNRYLWNAWHEWVKTRAAKVSSHGEEHTKQNNEPLLDIQADWYWAVWYMLYNQDYTGLQAALQSFAQYPADAIIGIIWLVAAYKANVFAQEYSSAGQRVLAKAVPALAIPLLAKPLSIVIGFSFAFFIKDYVTWLLEMPLSYANCYDKNSQSFYAQMYWAGNKGPFAWDGAKAIAIALAAGTDYLHRHAKAQNYWLPNFAKLKAH